MGGVQSCMLTTAEYLQAEREKRAKKLQDLQAEIDNKDKTSPVKDFKKHIDDMSEVLLLQGFNWESAKNGHWYDVVGSHAGKLSSWGITDIWLPPPSQSVASEGYFEDVLGFGEP